VGNLVISHFVKLFSTSFSIVFSVGEVASRLHYIISFPFFPCVPAAAAAPQHWLYSYRHCITRGRAPAAFVDEVEREVEKEEETRRHPSTRIHLPT